MKPVADAAAIHLTRGNATDTYQTFANESAVRRLLLILVDNAIKYCKPGGSAHIGLSLRDSAVCLFVEDEGPGISEEEMPFFSSAFTGGATRETMEPPGLGLVLPWLRASPSSTDPPLK